MSTESMNALNQSYDIQWRIIDGKGSVKELPEEMIGKLRAQVYIYKVCERHKIVCSGRKAHRLHLQEEHSY
ncbi:MAG: hypothetical protein ACRD5H_13855 [Nitrososphaerales archaeon]